MKDTQFSFGCLFKIDLEEQKISLLVFGCLSRHMVSNDATFFALLSSNKTLVLAFKKLPNVS
jgi:hypothetical protein